MNNADGCGQEGKSFHTSARAQADFPTTDADGSREPTEKDLHGEQNEHLKHKEEGEKDKGKGNAAEDPHLPSKTRKFHTSARSMATKPPGGYAKAISPEPVSAGYVSQ